MRACCAPFCALSALILLVKDRYDTHDGVDDGARPLAHDGVHDDAHGKDR